VRMSGGVTPLILTLVTDGSVICIPPAAIRPVGCKVGYAAELSLPVGV
jgi:hypothetical protein